eukprot:4228319-Amphidinium_carterae.1
MGGSLGFDFTCVQGASQLSRLHQAHERSLHTDVLFALMKHAAQRTSTCHAVDTLYRIVSLLDANRPEALAKKCSDSVTRGFVLRIVLVHCTVHSLSILSDPSCNENYLIEAWAVGT